MNRNLSIQISLSLAVLIVISGLAAAQAPIKGQAAPLSNVGGHTGQLMRNIYTEAIGTGYSVQSLNSIALSNARAKSNYQGQPVAPAPQQRLNFPTPGSGGGAAKPFSNFSPSPTTSPYLNLFREDLGGGDDFNYQTLVRPQLQQQAFNQQVQRQGQEMAQRMQSIAAQSDFNPRGDQNQFPTGHTTTFGYYGRFHPRKAYIPRR